MTAAAKYALASVKDRAAPALSHPAVFGFVMSRRNARQDFSLNAHFITSRDVSLNAFIAKFPNAIHFAYDARAWTGDVSHATDFAHKISARVNKFKIATGKFFQKLKEMPEQRLKESPRPKSEATAPFQHELIEGVLHVDARAWTGLEQGANSNFTQKVGFRVKNFKSKSKQIWQKLKQMPLKRFYEASPMPLYKFDPTPSIPQQPRPIKISFSPPTPSLG